MRKRGKSKIPGYEFIMHKTHYRFLVMLSEDVCFDKSHECYVEVHRNSEDCGYVT